MLVCALQFLFLCLLYGNIEKEKIMYAAQPSLYAEHSSIIIRIYQQEFHWILQVKKVVKQENLF